ncbi:bifunctional 4-hydroxy-2-oxoglutarate aldolase/2-dehydro-3-deoxy-phosphogluconate aldolase [Microbacterium sp.]|uniref:bifunctional 4-hydroxy-2-oxoglutarate aldolase/2-dehydro-3-deoxy-phosphogluconate aldolase n=1 Tax=Microbacterium sp. TaxID=51671 RepID=UPI003A88866B
MTDLLEVLRADRALALPRLAAVPDPVPLVAALSAGGIRTVEFAFTTPGVEEVIAAAVDAAPESVLIGAGTVTSADLGRRAAAAGAQFLVTPCLVPEVVGLGLPVLMGALTPTEVFAAHRAGAVAVKVFPAHTVGAAYFRHLAGPFPEIPLVASGGVDHTNAGDFLRAGALAVTAGSSVISAADVAAGAWEAVSARARAFTAG